MLGHLRFALAMLVVVSHLGGLAADVKPLLHWGAFAVFGFYLISGYLMTRILNETYSFRLSTFAFNRFLRLFPIYYIVAAGSAITIALSPSAGRFHSAWSVDIRLIDVLGNLLMVPFEFFYPSFRLIPPTWSIGVELINYFLLWLVVGRSRNLALAAVAIGAAYHVASFPMGLDWTKRYFPSYAAVLPFALGACIYYFRDAISSTTETVARRVAIVSFLAWIANLLLCGMVSGLGERHYDAFFYANLAALLVLVSVLTGPWAKPLLRRSGKVFGDIAYPVFLVHWIVGFGVSALLGEGYKSGLTLLALSVPPIIAISWLLAWVAGRWIEPWRDRVRGERSPA